MDLPETRALVAALDDLLEVRVLEELVGVAELLDDFVVFARQVVPLGGQQREVLRLDSGQRRETDPVVAGKGTSSSS